MLKEKRKPAGDTPASSQPPQPAAGSGVTAPVDPWSHEGKGKRHDPNNKVH